LHCTRVGARYTDPQQVDVQQGGFPPQAKGPVDVSTVLDEARFGPLQLVVLAFTFLTLVMDGFDIQAIAFAAPALTEAWGIERSSLGPVLAAALLGMAAGAAGIGVLGDRYGRKTALTFSCVLMAVGSLASAFATGPMELAALRFVTGVGLGGALPNSTALMFEFAPKAWRQVATSAALVGVPLGGMLGAALARSMIPELGWQALFVVGGFIPALLAMVMWLALPESPRYLSARPMRYKELAHLLNRLAHAEHYFPTSQFVGGGAADSGKSAVAAIFASDYRRDTLTLWLIFFTNVFSVYFFFNWLPTVLASASLDFRIAVTGSLFFNLGGVFGALAASALTGRFGSRRVLSVVGALAVVSVIAIGFNGVFTIDAVRGSITALMFAMAAAGGCINALQIGMFSVAAHAYPTFCRSTGVGWSLAVARFGGIVSSFAGAAFFAMGMRPRHFFFFIAGMLALTFISVVALRRHIPPTQRGTSQ
jgi:AAHS family 4-hydroxybenzoate transporter-like MFS transporter